MRHFIKIIINEQINNKQSGLSGSPVGIGNWICSDTGSTFKDREPDRHFQ